MQIQTSCLHPHVVLFLFSLAIARPIHIATSHFIRARLIEIPSKGTDTLIENSLIAITGGIVIYVL